ncbi:MAG TPA: hypothetical protein VGM90_17950 [Kofleriaceae bacterium]|jgi:hypothetical protein
MKLRCLLTVTLMAASASIASADNPKLAGNVLVWVDAPLYLDASTDAPSIRLAKLDNGRTKDVGQVIPMHVLGTTGELVEVEPAAEIECGWWRMVRPDALASLRLYVQRADLAPVVTKAFSATFKNGTRISLQPGVAVVANTVAFHDGIAPVTVPDANLGLAYRAHAITPIVKPVKKTAMLDEKTDVMLGDATFTLGPWVSGSAERRGDRMLFPIAARCMTATVSAPTEHVHLNVSVGVGIDGGAGGTAGSKGGGSERRYLKVGTKLTSETGDHVVATLAKELEVATSTGARVCSDFVVTREEVVIEGPHLPDAAIPARRLHLCAPTADVVVEHHGPLP